MNQFEARVHLATVALVSFISSFLVARTFTTFFPSQVIITSGIHIHHFWFGIILLAVGGWLGINYRHKDIEIAAAILYGVGGGLIVDEVGLLLTFGDYWTGLTWVILVVMLAVISLLILLARYRKQIRKELSEHLNSKLALTLGIFLAAISFPFILQTDNLVVISASVGATLTAVIILGVFFVLREKGRQIR
jgi:cytochrome bd-type quinol oxidase subunit 2